MFTRSSFKFNTISNNIFWFFCKCVSGCMRQTQTNSMCFFFFFLLTWQKNKNLNSHPGRLARGAIVLKRLVLTWTEQRTCREKGGCGVNVGDWSKRYCTLRVQDAILKTIFQHFSCWYFSAWTYFRHSNTLYGGMWRLERETLHIKNVLYFYAYFSSPSSKMQGQIVLHQKYQNTFVNLHRFVNVLLIFFYFVLGLSNDC